MRKTLQDCSLIEPVHDSDEKQYLGNSLHGNVNWRWTNTWLHLNSIRDDKIRTFSWFRPDKSIQKNTKCMWMQAADEFKHIFIRIISWITRIRSMYYSGQTKTILKITPHKKCYLSTNLHKLAPELYHESKTVYQKNFATS